MHSGASLAGAASLEQRRLRLLWLALLGSLALHALILFLLPLVERSRAAPPAPPPITAQLAKPVPAPAPPQAESQPPATPRQVARTPVQAQPRPAPLLRPAPVPSAEPPRPAPESAAAAVPAPPQPAAPQAARTETPPASAPAAVASSPDPGSLARFRLELMEIARRYKRYPRIAQDNNWEGRVELRVAFAENGAMSALTVKKSAGRSVLDEEAQSMIRSAQPHAAIPPALRGKAFALEIPVDFSLKDER
jgi:periplasmic protein TonB